MYLFFEVSYLCLFKTNKKRKTCAAIIPAAGSSTRMKSYGDKLFLEISEKPVIVLTLLAFEKCEAIDEIIIPTREDMITEIKALCEKYSITKVKSIICGGSTRAESVLNGVIETKGRFDLIAIHDAARPFVSEKIISDTINAASRFGAAAPAVPVKDTVKKVEANIVVNTVPRETLSAIQTPQIFDSDLIAGALKNAVEKNYPITDDCSAVEIIGMKVFLTDGDYFNIKITTPEDMIFAEAIYKNKSGGARL